MTSMPQEARRILSRTFSRTGIVAYWPSIRSPYLATQISGPSGGQFGLSSYCQRQRSRLFSVAVAPKISRYMTSSGPRSASERREIAIFSPGRRAAVIVGAEGMVEEEDPSTRLVLEHRDARLPD